MENLLELFEDTIKDLYNAEKQFLKAMPKLMKSAQDTKLKGAIETHIAQSEGQLVRLEKIAEMGGFKPTGKVCKAAQGLVEEASEHLEEGKPGPTLDAAIITCAQKNEHYEICSYGTLIAWSKALGNNDAMALLEESLAEEKQTDELLGGISDSVNAAAVGGTSDKKPGAQKNGESSGAKGPSKDADSAKAKASAK